MNLFLRSSKRFVKKEGVDCIYKSASNTFDEIESTVVKTETSYTVRVYPKQIQATQYNYPTLVGKEVIMFYLADVPTGLVIKHNDTITHNGNVYKIQSWREHVARGEVCLYKILTVKG